MGKKREGVIRYEKKTNPEVFTYFTPESINRYDPAKAGWVPSANVEHATPVDVVNFMDDKKSCSKCTPIEVKVDLEDAPEVIDHNQVEIVEYLTTPVSKLEAALKEANDESLLHIIKTDERKTAVRMAEKELKSREQ